MIACVDVGYHATQATAACVVFADWTDEAPLSEHSVAIAVVEPYEPGAFYRRELPCLLRVLADVRVPLNTIIVDGFVWLGTAQPGLGAHLHEALERRTTVIGVAKTAYRGNTLAVPVLRGISNNPLYVTAEGIAVADAADHIRRMHGPYRIPTLLGHVDRLTRQGAPPAPAVRFAGSELAAAVAASRALCLLRFRLRAGFLGNRARSLLRRGSGFRRPWRGRHLERGLVARRLEVLAPVHLRARVSLASDPETSEQDEDGQPGGGAHRVTRSTVRTKLPPAQRDEMSSGNRHSQGRR